MRRTLTIIAVVLCTGCASVPVPSQPGERIETPNACKDVIARGGKC